jgi:hypothetical protein
MKIFYRSVIQYLSVIFLPTENISRFFFLSIIFNFITKSVGKNKYLLIILQTEIIGQKKILSS